MGQAGEPSSSKKLSILFIGSQMGAGGAQKVLLEQASWFHAHGHRVTCAFFYDKEGVHRAWTEHFEFRIVNLGGYRLGANALVLARLLMRGLWRLWRLARSETFDVVETFTHDSNLLGLPAAWLAGVPVRIATHHGVDASYSRLLKRLHTWVVNSGLAGTLVAVSEGMRGQATEEGVRRERIRVTHNGVEPLSAGLTAHGAAPRELNVPDGELVLLSVGRLVLQKDHETLIRAMPRVLDEAPRTTLLICGDGYLRHRLTALTAELGLEHKVMVLGRRPDVERLIAAADVFVLPSRWEGLPVAMLEAMAVGKPVVASRLAGVDEVIEDGVQGLLVPPGDVEALSAALLQLLKDRGKRERMGAAARERVEQSFSLERMCEQYLETMVSLLPRSKRS